MASDRSLAPPLDLQDFARRADEIVAGGQTPSVRASRDWVDELHRWRKEEHEHEKRKWFDMEREFGFTLEPYPIPDPLPPPRRSDGEIIGTLFGVSIYVDDSLSEGWRLGYE